jgi:hypothetical protein
MGIRAKKTILEQASDYVETAVEKAGPILADAKDRAGSALSEAREQAGPALADARAKAAPMLADARDKAAPILADARDKATPLIVQGASFAADKASLAADLAAEKAAQGKELATAKAAELTGNAPKKKHRLRTLLIVTGIAAVIGFVAKKLTSGGDKDNWQSTYTPPSPPRGSDTPIGDAVAASSTDSADEGGAGPDEALADAVEESPAVTTPDEPADVIDVSPGEEPVAKNSGKP